MHNAQSFGDAQSPMPNAQSFGDAQCVMYNAQSCGDAVIGINPCVEMNLRPTMGAVTSVLGERVLAKGATGTFAIEQRASTSEPWRPLPAAVVKDCRLASGALCLTTSSPSAMYRAVLEVNP